MIRVTLDDNGTSDSIKAPPGPGFLRVLFGTAGGSITVEQSLDDVDENFEECETPDGEAFTTTSTKTYRAQGNLYYRIVGSGGVTDAALEWQSGSQASA